MTKKTLGFVLTGLLGLAAGAQAQSYSIAWYKIAGGGGASSGGNFTLNGTIGQHDAGGPMTGGSFSLVGGFWAVSAVSTPGAPNLAISVTGPNSVTIGWPATGNYTLLQTSDLASGNWTPSPGVVTTANGTNSVTISPPLGNLFFRLMK